MEYHNIVADGSLKQEFDMDGLREYVNGSSDLTAVEESGATNGIEINIVDDKANVVVHQNGTYVIKCGSKQELFDVHKKFIKYMLELDLIHEEPDFSVNNVVAGHNLEININLNSLYIKTISNSTYEPETFPAVTYQPSNDWSVNIYANGKLIVAASSFDDVKTAIKEIEKIVEEINNATTVSKNESKKSREISKELRGSDSNLNWTNFK